MTGVSSTHHILGIPHLLGQLWHSECPAFTIHIGFRTCWYSAILDMHDHLQQLRHMPPGFLDDYGLATHSTVLYAKTYWVSSGSRRLIQVFRGLEICLDILKDYLPVIIYLQAASKVPCTLRSEHDVLPKFTSQCWFSTLSTLYTAAEPSKAGRNHFQFKCGLLLCGGV